MSKFSQAAIKSFSKAREFVNRTALSLRMRPLTDEQKLQTYLKNAEKFEKKAEPYRKIGVKLGIDGESSTGFETSLDLMLFPMQVQVLHPDFSNRSEMLMGAAQYLFLGGTYRIAAASLLEKSDRDEAASQYANAEADLQAAVNICRMNLGAPASLAVFSTGNGFLTVSEVAAKAEEIKQKKLELLRSATAGQNKF